MTLLSFSRDFIFIKTRKTAGTSLEIHLAAQCGPDDIVTPIYPAVAGHQPRNHDGYYNHMPAREIRHLQPDFVARAFKFAFERHPVDKCLSYFAMLVHSPAHRRPDNPQSWSAYLDRGDFPVDAHLYTDQDGMLIVDRLYRYEEMDTAMRDLPLRARIGYKPLTTREKSGFRTNEIPSLDAVMADRGMRKLIFDAFASTLNHIDYV